MQESSGPLLANASQPIWMGGESDPAFFTKMYTICENIKQDSEESWELDVHECIL